MLVQQNISKHSNNKCLLPLVRMHKQDLRIYSQYNLFKRIKQDYVHYCNSLFAPFKVPHIDEKGTERP